MILVDTSIWITYLRAGVSHLATLLEEDRVLTHPWVLGELVLGHLRVGGEVHRLLDNLRSAEVATHPETMALVTSASLAGSGIGYVDAQLLASARMTPDTRLWTGDKRLHGVAARLDVAYVAR